MNKFEKSQILMLSLLSILLILAPLLSSSLRTPYLYVITNLLIIALGAQAGLLSSFSKPSDHHHCEIENNVGTGFTDLKPVIASELASSDKRVAAHNDEDQRVVSQSQSCVKKANKVVEKSRSEKIVESVKMESVRKCPSMPSLFFIGCGEGDHEDDNHAVIMREEEEVGGELSGQELYAKAETFIGNFYKQLKMQREDSWKKINEFYHKAF